MRALNLLLLGFGLWNYLLSARAETFDPEKGYVGIAVSPDKNADYPAVTYVAASGPAALAGVKAGDGIVAVDGDSTQGMSGTEIMPRIDGEVGTAVVIALRREGAQDAKITVMRQSLLDTYMPAAAGGDPKAQSRVGYFYEFGPAQTRDLAKAVEPTPRRAAEATSSPPVTTPRSPSGSSSTPQIQIRSGLISRTSPRRSTRR